MCRQCCDAADCPAPAVCHSATCVGGVCGTTPLTDTACDDGNACTQTDTCQDGVCVGGNPVVCPAPSDDCHVGSCDPATGQCTAESLAPHGTACTDGNPLCINGACCTAGHEVVHGGCYVSTEDPFREPCNASCTGWYDLVDGRPVTSGGLCGILITVPPGCHFTSDCLVGYACAFETFCLAPC
jgi:hypothetical protein